jgi:hypothetical protein
MMKSVNLEQFTAWALEHEHIDIAKMEIKPGTVLIIRIHDSPLDFLSRFREYVEKYLQSYGHNIPVIVTNEKVEFEITQTEINEH